jgi:two-component system, LytTR family, response regulator
MPPYKVLIADDELLSRRAVKMALPADGSIEIVAECADGATALEQITRLLPHIVFLDVQMPSLTGMEVLEGLPAGYAPALIIVTAHDDHAVKAFEHEATDYLVKPFTQARFDIAFSRACKELQAKQNAAPLAERLAVSAAPRTAYRSRLSIREGVKLIIVPCDDICFIEAGGEYINVHTHDRKYLYSDTLQAMEAALDPAVFVRTHRSFIVNVRYIRELASHHNGDYTIIFRNGRTAKLSRNYRQHLLHVMG